MADLLLTLLFLGVPLLAGVVGSLLVLSAYSDLQSPPEEAEPTSLARARLPVFFVIVSVPFFFGLAYWLTLAGIESGYGVLQGSAYEVVLWIAASFSAVAMIAVASQTWLARSRLRGFISADFGRILPVMVISETSVVFAMVLCFLALARVPDFLAIPPALSSDAAGEIILVFQVYTFAALFNLLGVGLSLRVREISTVQGFIRMMRPAELAPTASVIALVWGYLQLRAL